MAPSISKLARRLSGKKASMKDRPERIEDNPLQEGLFHPDPRRLAQTLLVAEIVDEITTSGCSRSSSGMTVFIP